ncbi:Coq4 family protein [Hyphococcus flavus]|uniref:Coq4 family protein n=1 Tax=Hyphococcus flavus TaxID=1866326 RepID=A0AAE9ZD97_9PROT|nr:Coq4 family protein [Hyphococcus flavus]WDI32401.1 Coq4 family protein [Hyphococcus flavus]
MTPKRTATPEEVAPEDIVWINGFPTPPALPVRPWHAFLSVLRLVRNKEDTRQVFEVVSALSGGSSTKLFSRFSASPYGRRVVSEPIKLEKVLGDREYLRTFPEASLARAYLEFMEGENLTPDGLIDAAEEAGIDFRGETQFEEFRRLFLHLDVCHDLWHVLTGYGRDALGELCNLVYTRHQTKNPGFKLIVGIGLLAIKAEKPFQPFQAAIAEAKSNAKQSRWILEYDVEELLMLPLADARARLGITEPEIYNAIPMQVKENLLKPKQTQTQTQREQAHAVRKAA